MRWRIAVALVCVAGSALFARDAPPGTVTLDVVAQDARGRPIEALGPSDFSITENTAALNVKESRLVRATGAADGAGSLPPILSADDERAAAASTRLFAVFLDEFHVTEGPRADAVRDALTQFVRDDLGPADLLVVLKPLDSLLEIRLSRDRTAALRSIQAFDPRRGDYTPRTAFERTFFAAAPPRIESTRAQVAASSLEALATHLGRLSPTRKTLIVVSEGFSPVNRRRADALLPGIEAIAQAANRARVSIYAIDPGETVAGPDRQAAAPSRESLRVLADATGGRIATGSENAQPGLRRALEDASAYYVLTLARPDPAEDGRLHPVSVSVRRPGVNLRVRQGYWVAAPIVEHVGAARAAIPFAAQFPRRTSALIRPWFGMAPGSNGATRVTFVWEPSPRVPGDRNRAPGPARVALSVTDLDGTPIFDGVVQTAGRGAAGSGTPTQASFETSAAHVLVQMAIQDVASRVIDRDVRDLVVGRFAGPVAIGTAEVLRARTAREFQTLTADPDAPPAASREFSRMERLIVRVPVSARGGQPEVTAQLVSEIGGLMRALAVTADVTRASRYQIDVPLAGLAAGGYRVEIRATARDGDARDHVAFRVTP